MAAGYSASMITQTSSLTSRVEQCRRLANHINDPAIRTAMLSHMRAIEQELAIASPALRG
jgi:hypothetical protein